MNKKQIQAVFEDSITLLNNEAEKFNHVAALHAFKWALLAFYIIDESAYLETGDPPQDLVKNISMEINNLVVSRLRSAHVERN